MSAQIITASRLRDGAVVWFGPDGRWVERVDEASVFSGETVVGALADAQRSLATQTVVDVYAVDVTVADGAPRPVRLRERLRAAGPSVRPDLGKQSDASTTLARQAAA